jgi:PPM family protein phosphatase
VEVLVIARLRNLFKKIIKQVGNSAQVKPLSVPDETEELAPPTLLHTLPPSTPPQLLAGCGQSTGVQRDHNEDSLFTLTTCLVSDTRQIPFGLYIVADGMGGHQNGEVASAQAVRTMARYLVNKVYSTLFPLTLTPPEESLQELMHQGVMDAHRAIINQSIGGGTTITALLILGGQMTIAHVGDSRAYAIDLEGQVKTLTRDHSLVGRLEELGQITSEEAAMHPQRNVLYRALGQKEPFEPDIISAPIPKPGYLLLCSDGLWGVVNQTEIVHVIATSSSPDQACARLVKAANEAGGPDNISAILVKVTN